MAESLPVEINYPGSINRLLSPAFLANVLVPQFRLGNKNVYCKLKHTTKFYIYRKDTYKKYELNKEIIEVKACVVKLILQSMGINECYISDVYFLNDINYKSRSGSLGISPRYYMYSSNPEPKHDYSPVKYFIFDDNRLSLYEKIKVHKQDVFQHINQMLYDPKFDGKSNPEIAQYKIKIDSTLWDLNIRTIKKTEAITINY